MARVSRVMHFDCDWKTCKYDTCVWTAALHLMIPFFSTCCNHSFDTETNATAAFRQRQSYIRYCCPIPRIEMLLRARLLTLLLATVKHATSDIFDSCHTAGESQEGCSNGYDCAVDDDCCTTCCLREFPLTGECPDIHALGTCVARCEYWKRWALESGDVDEDTTSPTAQTVQRPTAFPTTPPTKVPTKFPTKPPTKIPSPFPTTNPTKMPLEPSNPLLVTTGPERQTGWRVLWEEDTLRYTTYYVCGVARGLDELNLCTVESCDLENDCKSGGSEICFACPSHKPSSCNYAQMEPNALATTKESARQYIIGKCMRNGVQYCNKVISCPNQPSPPSPSSPSPSCSFSDCEYNFILETWCGPPACCAGGRC